LFDNSGDAKIVNVIMSWLYYFGHAFSMNIYVCVCVRKWNLSFFFFYCF